ncbi:uncharacterized protein LOC141643466 [Silene latifolia]|uniref:uncharacterized protein LOC141643466 n=1 Tax=Silene latifolia TaxID=37657 RepID=UPI003D777828
MSLILQNPLSNSIHRIKFFNPSKNPKFPINYNPFQSLQKIKHPIHKTLYLFPNHNSQIKAYDSPHSSIEHHEKTPSKSSTFDAFLSLMESLCVISSMVISVGCVVNWFYFKQNNNGLVVLGNRVLVWLLTGAVALGSVIRRREWSRVCGSKGGNGSGNLIERVEKLEESMRSSIGIIRMLSRQLEKLGNRFRVTRKALKDPISKAAALAQKNSEAIRDLAVQEDVLENEIAEVQKVLLAMQDQQQKQLELILAIAKNGKLLESKRASNQAASMNRKNPDKGLTQENGQPIQAIARQKAPSNNEVVGS